MLCSNRQGWISPLRHSLRRKRAQPNRNRQKIRHFSLPESDGDYDLVFFFATADIGDYEFSIAPEGSDDWQKLDEAHWLGTCGQSEEHSRVHQHPLAYFKVRIPLRG